MLKKFPAALFFLLFPLTVKALDTCPIGSLTCTSDLAGYIEGNIFPAVRVAFMGILLAVLIITALKMLSASFNESTVSEARYAYLYSFIGTALVLGAAAIASSVVTFDLPDPEPASSLLSNVAYVLRNLLTISFVINIVIQAIRLIVGTEESARDSAKKNIIFGIFGAFIVVLADAIVRIFFTADAVSVLDETWGIIRFLATIFGALLVIGIVMSGLMLIVSVSDTTKDRAKKLFFACIITMILVLAAYGIVTVFIF